MAWEQYPPPEFLGSRCPQAAAEVREDHVQRPVGFSIEEQVVWPTLGAFYKEAHSPKLLELGGSEPRGVNSGHMWGEALIISCSLFKSSLCLYLSSGEGERGIFTSQRVSDLSGKVCTFQRLLGL